MLSGNYYIKEIRRGTQGLEMLMDAQQAEVELLRAGLGVLQDYETPKLPTALGSSAKYTEWEKEGLDKTRDEFMAVGKRNSAALGANLKLTEQLVKMLKVSGFSTVYRAHERGRLREISWTTELQRAMPKTQWTETYITKQYEQYDKTYASKEKARKDGEQAQKQALEQERQAEEQQRRRLTVIIKTCQQFELDTEIYTNIIALEDWLRGQDKYLDLAVAMRDTRSDWSDGFWRVRNGLSAFDAKSDTDTDRAIVDDITACMDCNDGDGRIFRDTDWSYDRIFELVDPAIMATWQDISEFREDS